MNHYLLHGKLTAIPGKGAELREILSEASRLVSTAKGCRLYLVSKDEADENSVWITEVWDSREAHSDSLKLKGVPELIAQAIPLLDGPPKKGQELEVLAGLEEKV